MRHILVIFVLTLLGLPVMAQESCPVKITDVRNVAMTVTVLFTNSSQSTINRAEFVVVLLDSSTGEHYLPLMESKKRVKPGKDGTASISPPQATQGSALQARAYLLDVTFADDSVWNDGGSHACALTAQQE